MNRRTHNSAGYKHGHTSARYQSAIAREQRKQTIFVIIMFLAITFSVATWIWAGLELSSMKGTGHEMMAQMVMSFAILSSMPIALLMIAK